MQRYAGVCVPAWCVAAAASPRVASTVMLAARGSAVGVRRGWCAAVNPRHCPGITQLCGKHQVRPCGSLLVVLVATRIRSMPRRIVPRVSAVLSGLDVRPREQ